jgi:hypothetical protein
MNNDVLAGVKKLPVEISEQEAYPLAERLFMSAGGFDLNKASHRRLHAIARQVRENGIDGIRIQARWASFGPEAYNGSSVSIGGEELRAEVFAQIAKEAVQGVYVYVITAGECLCGEEESSVKQFFAHMWGTAYVDAGRLLLESIIKEEAAAKTPGSRDGDFQLSPPFSPGFYGMQTADNIRIVRILGGEEMGIRCLDSGAMTPLKSCSGLFLRTDSTVIFPGRECLVCIGNKAGCTQCMIGNRRKLSI